MGDDIAVRMRQWYIAMLAGNPELAADVLAASGEIERLRNANRILRLGIVGEIDSGDAMDLARMVQSGDAVDWSKFPNGSLRKYVGLHQAYDEDLGDEVIRKMTE